MSDEYRNSILNPNALIEHLNSIIDKIESRRNAAISSQILPSIETLVVKESK